MPTLRILFKHSVRRAVARTFCTPGRIRLANGAPKKVNPQRNSFGRKTVFRDADDETGTPLSRRLYYSELRKLTTMYLSTEQIATYV